MNSWNGNLHEKKMQTEHAFYIKTVEMRGKKLYERKKKLGYKLLQVRVVGSLRAYTILSYDLVTRR